MYIVAIVAIVAIVGLVLLFMNNGSSKCGKQTHAQIPALLSEAPAEEASDLAGQGWFATTQDHKNYLKCKWDACDMYIKPSHPEYVAPVDSNEKRKNNADYRKCFLICKADVLSGAYPPTAPEPEVCQLTNATKCLDSETISIFYITEDCQEHEMFTESCTEGTSCTMKPINWGIPVNEWAFCE